MNLLADESVDFGIVEHLRNEGHSVTSIVEISPGLSDDDVLALARTDERLLVTEDKDFGEMVFRLRKVHAGVLLLRLTGLALGEKKSLVAEAIRAHGHVMKAAFSVISAGSVRIRSTN